MADEYSNAERVVGQQSLSKMATVLEPLYKQIFETF